MKVQHIAAISVGNEGGNPAGVVFLENPALEVAMKRVAAKVGYSETVFASPNDGTGKSWRVRYFSPESEVPFCGHATVALGAALGQRNGPGTYKLELNEASITVEAQDTDRGMVATLLSPPTFSRMATAAETNDLLALFDFHEDDIDDRLPPARIHAGAEHIVLGLKDRAVLGGMEYDLDQGRSLMRQHGIVTIMLVYVEENRNFSVRNAFASGGVLEDPATGAAAAAFAGYLRDLGWDHGGQFTILQGDDMGVPSVIEVGLTNVPGSSIRISGRARDITNF